MGAGRRAEAVMLARLADLPEGRARGVEVPGWRAKAILIRRGGRVLAWRDLCPHYEAGTPMAWKRDAYLDATGCYLMCAAHGALFEIETGACVQGPCLGKRLTRVPVHVDDTGAVRLGDREGRG